MRKLLFVFAITAFLFGCSKSDGLNEPDVVLSGDWTATATYKKDIVSQPSGKGLARKGEIKNFPVVFKEDGTGSISNGDNTEPLKYWGGKNSFKITLGRSTTGYILFGETFGDSKLTSFTQTTFELKGSPADIVFKKN